MKCMPTALRLRYVGNFLRSTGYGPDVPYNAPAVAIFLPEQQLLVKPRFIPRHASVEGDLEINIGDQAQSEYGGLLAKLQASGQEVEPEKFEVGEDVANWIRAVYQVRNPPEQICELLK